MSDNENQNIEISIKSLIAFFIKKLNSMIAVFIIGLLVFGSYKAYKNFGSKSQKANEEKVEEWQTTLSIQKENLAAVKKQRDLQFSYNDEAPIMQINSDAVVKTVVPFLITSDETFTITSSSGDREMPLAYIIAQKYIDDWKSVDIISVVNNGITEDSWLREMIFLNTSESNLAVSGSRISSSAVGVSNTSYTASCPLVLTVFSKNLEEGLQLSTIITDFLFTMKEKVETESFTHVLVQNQVKQTVIRDTTLATYQNDCVKRAESYNKQFNTLTNTVKSTSGAKPKITFKGIIKPTLIGAIAITFVACFFVLLSFIVKMPLTSSYEFADYTHKLYLGSVCRRRNWCERLADIFLNERVFKSQQDAFDFIISNSKTVLSSGKRILVASTVFKDGKTAEVDFLISILKNAGYQPEFIGSTTTSPLFFSKLNEVECVILLEKKWRSRWQNINTELATIKRLNKEVTGYILV